MRVQATKAGFIHGERKRAGDRFDVHVREYSDRWMKKLDDDKGGGSGQAKTTPATAGPAADGQFIVKWNLGRAKYQLKAPDGQIVEEYAEKRDAEAERDRRNQGTATGA